MYHNDIEAELDYSLNNIQIGSVFELIMENMRPLNIFDSVNKPKPVNGGTIPVRKIFVNNVSPHAYSEHNLSSIFQAFGDIYKIGYPKHPNGERKRYIFITYYNPNDAQKALNSRKSLHERYKFYINPADQWHQPLELPNGKIQWFRGAGNQNFECASTSQSGENLDLKSQNNQTGLNATTKESESAISMLNDDCLNHIFSFLTKRELIGIERVCKRWRDVSLGLWLKETALDFKNVFVMEQSDCLYTDHFRELLLRCGDHITTLDISYKVSDLSPQRTLNLISKHCKNLTHLNISRLELNKNSLTAITANIASNLKELYMDRCEGLSDPILSPLLETATDLETLSISRTTIAGKSLLKLSNKCKNLNINFCHRIYVNTLTEVLKKLPSLEILRVNTIDVTSDALNSVSSNLVKLTLSKTKFFFDFCKYSLPSFPRLQTLDLSYDPSVNDEILSELPKMCPLLEKLNISGCDSLITLEVSTPKGLTSKGIEQLARLPKLTCLKVNFLKCITSETFEFLAGNTNCRLKKIECKACLLLTDLGLSRLVALSPELSSIDASHCRQVTNAFLKSALDSVKLRTNRIPLRLNVACTGADQFSFEENNASHPLLKIEYKPSGSDWIGVGFESFSDSNFDDISDDENFMDELGSGSDSDFDAQSMFGDEVEIFEWYQHGQGDWDFENDYDTGEDGFSDDDDDDADHFPIDYMDTENW